MYCVNVEPISTTNVLEDTSGRLRFILKGVSKMRNFQNIAISIPFICQRYPLEETFVEETLVEEARSRNISTLIYIFF